MISFVLRTLSIFFILLALMNTTVIMSWISDAIDGNNTEWIMQAFLWWARGMTKGTIIPLVLAWLLDRFAAIIEQTKRDVRP